MKSTEMSTKTFNSTSAERNENKYMFLFSLILHVSIYNVWMTNKRKRTKIIIIETWIIKPPAIVKIYVQMTRQFLKIHSHSLDQFIDYRDYFRWSLFKLRRRNYSHAKNRETFFFIPPTPHPNSWFLFTRMTSRKFLQCKGSSEYSKNTYTGAQ